LQKLHLEQTKKSIHDCSQAVFEHSDNATISILGYYSNLETGVSKFGFYTDSQNLTIYNTIESVDEALNNISSYTSNENNSVDAAIYGLEGLIENGFYSSECDNKYAFIISDSPYTFTNRIGYKDVIPKRTRESLEYIYNEGVRLNFLLSPSNYSKTSAVKNLSFACNIYDFNIYSKSDLGYFSNTAFSEIYNDAIDNSPSFVAYTGSLTPKPIPKEVNRNAFINSITEIRTVKIPEADENGNINFESTVVHVGFADYDANGNLIFESYYDACEDDTLTLKGYNQLLGRLRTSTRLVLGSIQITPFSEKIMFADNDKDGLANKDDPYPDTPFDERFEIVSDYNNIPTINWVEEHIEFGEKCSCSKIPNPFIDVANKTMFCVLADLGATTPGLELWLRSPFLTGNNLVGEFENIISVNFSKFISWYLFADGEPLYLSQDDMYSIIMGAKHNREHYSYNVNQIKKVIEETITTNNTSENKMCIAVKPESLFKGACYKGNYCQHKGYNDKEFNDTKVFYDDATALDWGYAIGESLCTMSAEAYMVDGEYCMNLKYYIIDNYEFAYHWEEYEGNLTTEDKAGHRLHETGTGNEYKIIGVYEDFIRWEAGETLYQNDYAEIKLDEEKYNAGPYR